jgi:hypothetical protein
MVKQTPTLEFFHFFPKIGVLWVPLCSFYYVGTKKIAIGEKTIFQRLFSCGFLCVFMTMLEQNSSNWKFFIFFQVLLSCCFLCALMNMVEQKNSNWSFFSSKDCGFLCVLMHMLEQK